MSTFAKNQQLDNDILQCKADILRARNSIPLQSNIGPKNPETQNNTTETKSKEMPVKKVPTSPAPTISKKQTVTSEKKSEIPKFDLAEEIMAEQRKITAIRRKPPGQKNKIERLRPKAQSVDHITEQPAPSLSEQDKVIAEIVARDIEKLCQG